MTHKGEDPIEETPEDMDEVSKSDEVLDEAEVDEDDDDEDEPEEV